MVLIARCAVCVMQALAAFAGAESLMRLDLFRGLLKKGTQESVTRLERKKNEPRQKNADCTGLSVLKRLEMLPFAPFCKFCLVTRYFCLHPPPTLPPTPDPPHPSPSVCCSCFLLLLLLAAAAACCCRRRRRRRRIHHQRSSAALTPQPACAVRLRLCVLR